MQPRRLLQASCLLLLSAAVLARVDPNAEVKAVIAAARPQAAMPAELKPAAFNCFKAGAENCKAGTACDYEIEGGNCLLCQNVEEWTCNACKAGFYPDEEDTVCEECEQGFYCGGTNIRPCPAGATTEAPGQWSASQCSTCWPGYGPGPGADGSCSACGAGTAKNLIGTKECDYCLDGFIAESNAGATDCLNAHGDPEEACAATDVPIYIEAENSCGCEAGSYLVLPFTNGEDDKPTCEECEGNTIAAEDGALECEACPAGTVANYDKTECVEDPDAGSPPSEEEEEEEEEKEKEKTHKKHHKKHDKYEKEEKPEEEEYEKKEDKEHKEKEEEYEYKSKYGKKHAKKSHKKSHKKHDKYEKEEKPEKEEYEKEEKPEKEEYEKEEKPEKEEYEKEDKPATPPAPKPYEYKYTPKTEEEYKPATPAPYGGEYKAPYGEPKAPYGEPKAPYGEPKAPYGEPKAPYGDEYKPAYGV